MWMQELEIKKMNCKSVGVQHGAMTTVVDYSPLYYLLTNKRQDDGSRSVLHQTTNSPVANPRKQDEEHVKNSHSQSISNTADTLFLTSAGKVDFWGNVVDDGGRVLD